MLAGSPEAAICRPPTTAHKTALRPVFGSMRVYQSEPNVAARSALVLPTATGKVEPGAAFTNWRRLPDVNQVVAGPIRRAEAQEEVAVVVGEGTVVSVSRVSATAEPTKTPKSRRTRYCLNVLARDPRERTRGAMQRFRNAFVIMSCWCWFAESSVVTVDVAFLVYSRPFGRLQKLFAYHCGVLTTAW